MAKLQVGQRVEIMAGGYAARTGTIIKISDCGQYHDVRADNGAMVYLTGDAPRPANPELVSPDYCCTCGERRMDWLVWTEDAINVRCASCGEIFRPGG